MAFQKNILFLLVLLVILCFQTLVRSKNIGGNDCPKECVANDCPQLSNCLAGLISDHCDCCQICARREGERCFNENLRSKVSRDYEHYEECGENLECRLRTDLSENDLPEAICYCKKTHPVCGSDNITYDNECQFTEARYKKMTDLSKIDDAPCPMKPEITSGPEEITESIGESISFMCEAKGWPIPEINWKVFDNGVEMPLPTDDLHISVRSHSDLAEYETTSWLQISAIERRHSGTYICVAHNSQGEQRADSKLIVGNYNRKPSLTQTNRIDEEL